MKKHPKPYNSSSTPTDYWKSQDDPMSCKLLKDAKVCSIYHTNTIDLV